MAAKRTKKTIPTNLTLVDLEVVRDDETTTATKPTPRRKGPRAKKTAEVAPLANDTEIDAHEAPVAARKAKAKKAPKSAETLTMSRLRDLYLDHLERVGKSLGTRFSYGIDLAVACGVLGPDTRVADLTVDDVRRYFDSPAVTKTRGGKEKAPVTTAKMRRVLRLALVWAAKEGMIATAPIPLDPIPPRGAKTVKGGVTTGSTDPS